MSDTKPTDIVPVAERKAIAAAHGFDEQFLYQCLTGRNQMHPAEAVRLERLSGNRIRRWQVRRSDWHLIWPEVVGAAMAAGVPIPSDMQGA
jgi:DNA-binding transcriptional regulator YdaS (Cro superfamily)